HQVATLARGKGPVRNLLFESVSPAAGKRGPALRTATLRRQPVVLDEVPITANQRMPAFMAVSILKIAHSPRQVPGIDVTQPGGLSYLRSTHQVFGFRVRGVGHLVVFMKSRHVPGNLGRDARDKFSQPLQFVIRVVESRDEKRDNLNPYSHRVQPA